MSYSFTSAAAVSSCVESGLEAQSATRAPPALSVSISTAVSVVTCRHAPRRRPLSGCSLAKRSRTWRRTGIDCSAHSILSRPSAASSIFLTSCSTMLRSSFRSRQPWWIATFERRLRRRNPVLGGGRAEHAEGVRCPSEGGQSPPSELESCVVPQILHAIGALPGEVGLRAAEVPIGGRLLVDGPAQVEVLDDARRREVEVAADQLLELRVRHLARAERVHHDRDRIGHAD